MKTQWPDYWNVCFRFPLTPDRAAAMGNDIFRDNPISGVDGNIIRCAIQRMSDSTKFASMSPTLRDLRREIELVLRSSQYSRSCRHCGINRSEPLGWVLSYHGRGNINGMMVPCTCTGGCKMLEKNYPPEQWERFRRFAKIAQKRIAAEEENFRRLDGNTPAKTLSEGREP